MVEISSITSTSSTPSEDEMKNMFSSLQKETVSEDTFDNIREKVGGNEGERKDENKTKESQNEIKAEECHYGNKAEDSQDEINMEESQDEEEIIGSSQESSLEDNR